MRPVAVPAVHHGDGVELTDRSNHATTAGNTFKEDIEPAVREVDSEESHSLEGQDAALRATRSTAADGANMRRMGKEQQLVRYFRFFSITSFTAIATATWEIGLFVITPALVDGGRAGLLWNAFWCFLGFAPIYLSMAEMASMAPIAGAQYHWVSEFAPENCQRFLSYLTGWTSTIAWQAGNCMGIFLAGSLIQTMILVGNEDYAFPAWHGTMLAIGAMLVSYIANVYGSRALPYWQNAVFAIHVAAYFAYIIPVWVSAPTATHSQVWTEFQNEGGWSNVVLAVLIGQLSGISNQVGIDTAAHMSEEVKDASASIPKAMMSIYVVNFLLLFPALVTICYHIPDLTEALNDSTTYPAVYVLRQSMSTNWILGLMAVITLLQIASNIVYLTAVSRDLFAFARDQGLPCSKWLSTVDPKRHVPVNAARFSAVIAILLSLIYIGSSVAFYAITSLSTVSLLQCYSLSIGCVLWRRIFKPETLPPARFSLGKFGIPINIAAVCFAAWSFFWCFWPQATPVTAEGFNWASPIFSLALIVAMVFFFFKGRHVYFGPVVEVEGRKAHFR
ncbi:amino acid permease-like protein 7 [Elsinoe australis]|uniref:Amino acid permease-like protein 7 n=1 Tax=Elsinoe australis TaxID=40998 RepID=A0A4U7APY9_9PEZI|nr:amino acid permease-like protein 7 [Elsinoe australis]